MTDIDVNADLIGYEFDIRGESDGVTRWRVTGSDNVLGANYVQIRRVADGAVNMRVQNAGVVRRRKQLEAGAS